MIERVHLENFKANRDVDVLMAPLTVLAGLNSSGKSSLLQAIAVLRQSYAASERTDRLVLGGDLIQLGHGRDVLSERAVSLDDLLVLEFLEDRLPYRWACRCVPDLSELVFQESPKKLPHFLQSLNFQFLQADRIAPSPLYPQASLRTQSCGFLGPRGQYTADVLARRADEDISDVRSVARIPADLTPSLLARVSPTPKLIDQVAGWLQHLSPGVRPTASRVAGTDEVLLTFNYVGHGITSGSNEYRPTNVGFGLTYGLPIVLACLAVPRGGLLLLENPEAHLHPRGQVALGGLLALVASDEVQVVVETHSDHLLNGIRLAVKRKQLAFDKVAIHFFTRDIETGDSDVESPKLTEEGSISDWPEGFFDQWDKSLEALLD